MGDDLQPNSPRKFCTGIVNGGENGDQRRADFFIHNCRQFSIPENERIVAKYRDTA